MQIRRKREKIGNEYDIIIMPLKMYLGCLFLHYKQIDWDETAEASASSDPLFSSLALCRLVWYRPCLGLNSLCRENPTWDCHTSTKMLSTSDIAGKYELQKIYVRFIAFAMWQFNTGILYSQCKSDSSQSAFRSDPVWRLLLSKQTAVVCAESSGKCKIKHF